MDLRAWRTSGGIPCSAPIPLPALHCRAMSSLSCSPCVATCVRLTAVATSLRLRAQWRLRCAWLESTLGNQQVSREHAPTRSGMQCSQARQAAHFQACPMMAVVVEPCVMLCALVRGLRW